MGDYPKTPCDHSPSSDESKPINSTRLGSMAIIDPIRVHSNQSSPTFSMDGYQSRGQLFHKKNTIHLWLIIEWCQSTYRAPPERFQFLVKKHKIKYNKIIITIITIIRWRWRRQNLTKTDATNEWMNQGKEKRQMTDAGGCNVTSATTGVKEVVLFHNLPPASTPLLIDLISNMVNSIHQCVQWKPFIAASKWSASLLARLTEIHSNRFFFLDFFFYSFLFILFKPPVVDYRRPTFTIKLIIDCYPEITSEHFSVESMSHRPHRGRSRSHRHGRRHGHHRRRHRRYNSISNCQVEMSVISGFIMADDGLSGAPRCYWNGNQAEQKGRKLFHFIFYFLLFFFFI